MYLSDKLLFFPCQPLGNMPALRSAPQKPAQSSMLICLSSISNVLKAEVVSNVSVEMHLNGLELASTALRLKGSIEIN